MNKILLSILLACLCIVGLWQLSNSRNYQFFGSIIPRVETTQRLVALTFDDGPTEKYTAAVVNVLKEHGAKATFFVTGQEVERYPEQAKMLIREGHQLGNHSYSHPRMIFKSPKLIASEIERTDQAIRGIGYEGNILFRPPYGKKLFVLPWYLEKTNRVTVTWDIEPESWPGVANSAENIAKHVMEKVKPGSIILLHVMYDSREESRKAVPLIITGLKQKGFAFVTVSELLETK